MATVGPEFKSMRQKQRCKWMTIRLYRVDGAQLAFHVGPMHGPLQGAPTRSELLLPGPVPRDGFAQLIFPGECARY